MNVDALSSRLINESSLRVIKRNNKDFREVFVAKFSNCFESICWLIMITSSKDEKLS